MQQEVYVLGGFQTDFAQNWQRSGLELFDVFRSTVLQGLTAAQLAPDDVDVAHIGNFAAELFCGQGHLGGFFAASDPAFSGIPSGRHEGACASGSLAALAAAANIEAGRYGLAAVIGIEQMRNVPGAQAAANIGGPAMWNGHECVGVQYPWPHVFSRLGDEYDRRYGLRAEHLAQIAQLNFSNARRNPNAQTRAWQFDAASFAADDQRNPVIDGRIRKQDCGQITDGAAIVFLASAERAARYAQATGISLEDLPRIVGWGHRTAPISYAAKIEAIQAKEVEEKKLKAKLEVENREKAIQAAIEAQAKRKLEREAKEKFDEEKRTARQTAEDKRERAFSDRNKLADQKRRLEKDLLEVKEEVEKIEKQKKTFVDEQAFLKNYIKQAESNVKSYYDLLDKLALAEKARAEAAAIAAAAAKKNS